MSRWRGGIIRSSLPTVSGGKYGNASGIFNLSQQEYYASQNTWPVAATVPIGVSGTAFANVVNGAFANVFPTVSCIGGAGLTASYSATSCPGSITASSSSFPITVTGLTLDQPYTFTVQVTNKLGSTTATTSSVTPPGDATLAIHKPAAAARSLYTFSSDTTSTSVTAGRICGIQQSNCSTAYGTKVFTIIDFNKTAPAGTLSPFRCKYTYSCNTNTAGTNAPAAHTRSGSAGNNTVGIINHGCQPVVGTPSSVRSKYTYSGDVVASATASSVVNNSTNAAGNSTLGLFRHGHQGSLTGTGTLTEKYTYSGDTQATGTAAAFSGLYTGSATSTGTIGYFQAGCTPANGQRCKYTYAGDTQASGTSSTFSAGTDRAAFGNSFTGYFTLYNSTTREKYTYAGDTQSSGAVATATSFFSVAGSNGIYAVNR